jgi:hypothetical protein
MFSKCPSEYPSTRGIIFCGTPHRGSDKVSFGEMVAKVANASLRQPNTQLLETLRRDSDVVRKTEATVCNDIQGYTAT